MDLLMRVGISLVVSLLLAFAAIHFYRRRSLKNVGSGKEAGGTETQPAAEIQWKGMREELLSLMESAGSERRRLTVELERSARLGAALRAAGEGSAREIYRRTEDRYVEQTRRTIGFLSEKGFSLEEISERLKLGELEIMLYLEMRDRCAA
jgi:hypothetical protein